MRFSYLFLIFLISKSAYAEWMQGYYRVTCVPEIGYFEISPHWVSGPNTENKDVPQELGLYKIGVSQSTECLLFPSAPRYSQKIKVIGFENSPFFDLYINDIQMIKGVSFRTQHPVHDNSSKDRDRYHVDFLNFVVNGTSWSFKAFLKTSSQYQVYNGSLLHLWGKGTKLPISYELIENEYLNKTLQADG